MNSDNVKTILGGSSSISSAIVDVECHLSNNLPNIVIVGFASKSVDEAKERIRGALANSRIKLPRKRITINLAPADIPKQGSSFDLAIAISILQASKMVSGRTDETIVIGELGLDGSIRPVRGMIGKLLSAKRLGYSTFIIPYKNLAQAQLIPDIKILPVKDLKEVFEILQKRELNFKTTEHNVEISPKRIQSSSTLFEHVVGQQRAKRALIIAAAGNHNILLSGPPGTGKSMLAKALKSILPPMNTEEILEVTHLHSLANQNFEEIVTERPVRSPHHSSSQVSIIGGGSNPKPGEISLSHNGVLFFDEFPEFTRSVIESLRQPLEDGKITVSRAKDSIDFPANFILVTTANPCPCGNFNTQNECSCLASSIIRYQKRISGPVLDRIDLYVDVDNIEHKKLLDKANKSQASSDIQNTVKEVREAQYKRNGKLNSQLTSEDLKKQNRLNSEAKTLLDQAAERLKLSARGYMRTLKVANTIADLNSKNIISPAEISEALQYRKKPVEL